MIAMVRGKATNTKQLRIAHEITDMLSIAKTSIGKRNNVIQRSMFKLTITSLRKLFHCRSRRNGGLLEITR